MQEDNNKRENLKEKTICQQTEENSTLGPKKGNPLPSIPSKPTLN